MADVLVLLAHPDLARSRVNRALAAQARLLPPEAVEVRDVYALYPDYVIDVEAEQAALAGARTVVWLHPIQWYSMPALMKLWVDEVLAFRWAYGPGGRALAGKCLWLAVSTGGTEASYRASGSNHQPFERFLPAYQQTAELVGMRFLDPLVFHGAHRADTHAVHAHAHGFAQRLLALAGETRAGAVAPPPEVAADERRITTD
jgi:glutathione-regulated potassium-efflux system ancillary protein KefF